LSFLFSRFIASFDKNIQLMRRKIPILVTACFVLLLCGPADAQHHRKAVKKQGQQYTGESPAEAKTKKQDRFPDSTANNIPAKKKPAKKSGK
jgi:hypothetical protein